MRTVVAVDATVEKVEGGLIVTVAPEPAEEREERRQRILEEARRAAHLTPDQEAALQRNLASSH